MNERTELRLLARDRERQAQALRYAVDLISKCDDRDLDTRATDALALSLLANQLTAGTEKNEEVMA